MIEQHSSLSEKFLKKGFWLYLFSFVLAPIWYAIKILISNELSVEEVWILYGVISLVTLLWAYNDLGITESLNHFIPKYVTKKRYDKVKSILVYSLLVQMITGVSIALFFFFWSDFIAEKYFKHSAASDILEVFSLFFIWINFFQIIATFFIAVQDTFLNKISSVLRMSFLLIFIIWLFILDITTLRSFSFAWIFWLSWWIIFAGYVFIKKYYLIYLQKEKIIWSKKLFTTIFKYSFASFLWIQAGTILGQIDMQMIIYILWAKEAGYYTNYLSIVSIPFMLIWPIYIVLFPIFSEMHSKKEYSKIRLVKEILNKNLLVIAIAFNILLFVFSEIIAYILFWEKFIKSGVILQYSILLLSFNFLLQVNFNILAWIWKVVDRMKIILIAIVINFFLNLIFINMIWVYGAALATGIGWVIIWWLSELFLWKNFKVQLDILYLLKNIIFLGIIWGGLYIFIVPIFLWLWRIQSLLYLSLLGMLYFWMFTYFNKKDFYFFINEIKKLRK